MNIRNIIYKRNIIANNIKSIIRTDINRIQSIISNITDRTTIKNNNSVFNGLLLLVGLCPIVPIGSILLIKYKKNLKFAYNKYYNQVAYNSQIKEIYGYEL